MDLDLSSSPSLMPLLRKTIYNHLHLSYLVMHPTQIRGEKKLNHEFQMFHTNGKHQNTISTCSHINWFNYLLSPLSLCHLPHPIDLISIAICLVLRSSRDFQPHITKHKKNNHSCACNIVKTPHII